MIKINVKYLRVYVLFILSFVVTILSINVCNNTIINVLLFLILPIEAIFSVNGDLFHPYTWFSAFFSIYSISFPVTSALHFVTGFTNRTSYSKEILIYQLIGLFVYLIIITPKRIPKITSNDISRFQVDIGLLNKLLYAFLVITLMGTVFYIKKMGFSGKDEIYSSGDIFLNMIFKVPLIVTLLYSYLFISYFAKTQKIPFKHIFIVGISLLLITLFSGERDFVFRFLLVTVLLLWFFNILKFHHLLIVVPSLGALLPLSTIFKYYFLRGTLFVYNSKNLLYLIFAGEFESAASNLQIVINHSENTEGVLGYKQLLIDVISAFDSNIPSPSSWFTNTFFKGSTTQYGFSLVGEGYVIGGILGIITVFVVMSLIVKCFYRKALKNIYCLCSYIYLVSVTIYSIRGDLGIIFSALLKQIGFIVLILYCLEKSSKRNRNREI